MIEDLNKKIDPQLILSKTKPKKSSSPSTARSAAVSCDTNETKIQLSLNLDGGP
jgi:hypothetical protein